MGWTYSDYDQQTTAAARLARGKLFLAELRNAVGRELDADGKRVSSTAIMELIKLVREELKDEKADTSIAGGVSQASMSGPLGADESEE